MISLDQRKDIVTDTLKELSTHVTEDSTALQDAETKWKQVLALRLNHGNMLDLPFIADVPLIGQLEQQVASQKIAVAQLSQRYRARHPTMIAAMDSLNAAEQQLQQAIDTATSQVQTAYQTALQNYNQARSALAAQEADPPQSGPLRRRLLNLERETMSTKSSSNRSSSGCTRPRSAGPLKIKMGESWIGQKPPISRSRRNSN